MPIPLIIPVLSALGGVVVGALSRQPEINRLKEQVKVLQAEVKRLQFVIKEQQRQINELKIRYSTLRGFNFIEKKKVLGVTKGFLYMQYGFKEYIELTIYQANGGELAGDELSFFNVFNAMMSEQEVGVEDKLLVANYVAKTYRHQIENLIPLNDEDQAALVERVECANA